MKTTAYSSLNGLLAALPVLALLPGCETVVDLPEPPHTPRIALQYTLSNTPPPPPPTGSNPNYEDAMVSRQLFVSGSQRIFDTKPLNGRDDARVEIRDEQGRVVEKFQPTGSTAPYRGSGTYEPTMGLLGEPGRTYTLHAALPGFGDAESTLTLPAVPVIESATFTLLPPGAHTSSNVTQGRLSVTVADAAATTDYYLAMARVLDKHGTGGNWSPVQRDYENTDSDFSVGQFQLSNMNSYHGYDVYPYPDTDANGQRVTLSQKVTFFAQSSCPSGCPEVGYIEVVISKITPDAYRFYQSQRRYADADGNLFAEPAPLSSNLKNGYGLFGGASDATYRIKLF